ncbi:MAG: hypothetical protein V3S34_03560 [Hyphomicrobium sp.]
MLIKSNIVPTRERDGMVRLVGKGRKTVDRGQIRERFEGLGLSLDWKRLDRISEIRNEIEHYFTVKPEPLIREAVSDAFVLVHRLVADHLNEMPIALLGNDTWQVLLDTNEVFEEQRSTCIQSFEPVSFGSETLAQATSGCICPSCGSSLIMQLHETNTDQNLIELLCSACGSVPDREDVFEAAIVSEMEIDDYVSFKETGERALEHCPECDRESYVLVENQCALCGFSLDDMTCAVCGVQITVDDYKNGDGELCGYHHHTLMKND